MAQNCKLLHSIHGGNLCVIHFVIQLYSYSDKHNERILKTIQEEILACKEEYEPHVVRRKFPTVRKLL